MDDKLIIHLNKNFGNIETNKNNEVLYNLKEPIKLNPGDTVSLYKAFLDVRGQSENTITIDEDIEEEIEFGFYVPQSRIQNAALDDNPLNVIQRRTSMMAQCPNHTSLEYGGQSDDQIITNVNPLDFTYNPPTNSPAILVKNVGYLDENGGSGRWDTGTVGQANNKTGQALFVKRSKTIKIPAGNYQVESIANLITLQMNGQAEIDNDQNNILFPSNKSFDQKEQNIFDNKLTVNVSDLRETAASTHTVGHTEADENNIWGDVQAAQLKTWQEMAQAVEENTTDTGMICLDLSTANRVKQEALDFSNGNLNAPVDDLHANPCGLIYPQFDGNTGVTGRNGTMRDEGEYDDGKGGTAEYDNVLLFTKFARFGYNMNNDAQQLGVLQWKENIPPRDNFTGAAKLDFRYALQDNVTGYIDFATAPFLGDQKGFMTTLTNVGPNPGDPIPQFDENNESNRIIGAKSFSCDFGDDSVNRFQISNLNEPYRIPTYSMSNIDNKIIPNDSSVVGNQATNLQLKPVCSLNGKNVNGCFYPQDTSSGIYITSWSAQLKKKGKKYLDIYNKRQALLSLPDSEVLNQGWKYIAYTNALNMMLHDEAYDNEQKAIDDWNSTLWSRLGFTYEQFGKLSANLEQFYTFQNLYRVQNNLGDDAHKEELFNMMGMITHNDANLSMATSLSGLGDSLIPDKQSLRYQTFGSLGTLDVPNTYPAAGSGGSNIGLNIRAPYEDTNLLCTSKYLNAAALPNLTGAKNYFVIESDIILNNYLDVFSNKKAVVGFISKENSEADTIFSTEGIPFTISNEKVLNSIMVRVLNPDGTDTQDAILQKNSAFIFIVERNKKEITNG